MTWTPSDVRRIARLARLDVPLDAVPRLAEQLGDVLAWIERIDRVTLVDSPSEAAACPTIDDRSPAREADDTPNHAPSFATDDVLRRAPAHRDGFFLVPES